MACSFRFFFDPGSGTCLWSANADARAQYGYAVDHHALPIGALMKAALDDLIARYDTWLDWNNPGSGGLWSDEDRNAFNFAARECLHRLRNELPNCTIADEAD